MSILTKFIKEFGLSIVEYNSIRRHSIVIRNQILLEVWVRNKQSLKCDLDIWFNSYQHINKPKNALAK